MSHTQQNKDSLATTTNVFVSLDPSKQKNPTWLDKKKKWMSSLFGKKVKPGRWMLSEVKNKQHLHQMKRLLNNSWDLLEYKQEKLKEEQRKHEGDLKCLHQMELWLLKRTEWLDEREKELHEGNQRLDDRKQRQFQVEKEQEEREERLQKEFIRQQEVSLSQEANQRRLEEKEEFLMRLTQHLQECEKRKHRKGFKKGKDWMLAKLKVEGRASNAKIEETFVFLSEKQKKQEEEEKRLQKLSKELQERSIQVQQEEQLMKENLRRMKSELVKNNLPQQKDRNQLQQVVFHPKELKPKEKEGPSGLPKMHKQKEAEEKLQKQTVIEEKLKEKTSKKKKTNLLQKSQGWIHSKMERNKSVPLEKIKEQQMERHLQERNELLQNKKKVVCFSPPEAQKSKDEKEDQQLTVDNIQVEQKEQEREKLSQPISHSKKKRRKWKAPFKMINI